MTSKRARAAVAVAASLLCVGALAQQAERLAKFDALADEIDKARAAERAAGAAREEASLQSIKHCIESSWQWRLGLRGLLPVAKECEEDRSVVQDYELEVPARFK